MGEELVHLKDCLPLGRGHKRNRINFGKLHEPKIKCYNYMSRLQKPGFPLA